MNIIIGQDKYVRLTQYSNQATYNLEDIVFYISKTLHQTNPIVILKSGLNNYPFLLLQEDIENDFYYIYKVTFTSRVSLQAKIYTVEVGLDDGNVHIGDIQFNSIVYTPTATFRMTRGLAGPPLYGLTDQHTPIDIDGKTREIKIGANNNDNTLLSGDNLSQSIRFRLLKYIDDMTDITADTKKIYIDYKLDPSTNVITSEEIDRNTYQEENIEGIDYLIVTWTVGNHITKKAGSIQFDLSITGENGYVWQTLPTTLTIKQSLGRNFGVPTNEPVVDPTYSEVLDFVKNVDYVSDIDLENNTLTKVTRTDGNEETETIEICQLLDNEEGEVVFSGGGALG